MGEGLRAGWKLEAGSWKLEAGSWKLEAIILSEWLGGKDLCRAHPVKRELG